MNKFNIDKLKEIAKPMSQKDIDFMKELEENKDWWKLSCQFALKIRKILRETNTSKEDFAKLLNVSLLELNSYLSGKYNFCLKTIAFIESKLKEIQR